MALNKPKKKPTETDDEPMRVIVVAGAGPVEFNYIDDQLSDWLAIEDEDGPEFRFYLPADRQATTDAVVHVAHWLDEVREPYTAITTDKIGRKGRGIADDAEDVIDDEGIGIVNMTMDVLGRARSRGEEPYLLLSWGPDADNAPDELTAELLDRAVGEGFPVLDLSMGLEDLGYSEPVDDDTSEIADDGENDDVPADDPEVTGELTEDEVELGVTSAEVVEEPGKSIRQRLLDKHGHEIENVADLDNPDEAQAAVEQVYGPSDDERFPDLERTLALAVQAFTLEDERNAAINCAEVRYRPLTLALKYHAEQIEGYSKIIDRAKENLLRAAEKPAEAPASPEQPKRRGKPRDTASDDVTVYHDPNKQTVRLVPGRGRPRNGEVKEIMTRAAFEALLAEYEAD
ncbi:hypothetical protein [Microbispora sp. NPDC049633]|uniref:hypothetical protein n=1 Tax=Microbispora sp. NPDC049633 TaxID=3154355 RepID=UPI00341FE9B2